MLIFTFGDFLGSLVPNLCNYEHGSTNFWVWQPHSSNLKLSSAIYHHLNSNTDLVLEWPGWHKLWRLHVAPRVKHFIWLMFHGRLSTTDFLNSINIGPNTLCIFCNLENESMEHLFLDCRYAQLVWNLINHKLNTNISFPDNISAGFWLTDYNLSFHTVSVIAACLWFLWKARCDAIFNNVKPNCFIIASKAIAHAKDHLLEKSSLLGRRLLLNNFTQANGLFLFYALRWNDSSKTGKVGFLVSNHAYIISCAGCCTFYADSIIEAGLQALCIAIRSSLDRHLDFRCILHCNRDLSQLLKADRNPVVWRSSHSIADCIHLLHLASNPSLIDISPKWNAPAFALSNAGNNNHSLCLFLSGRDLPRWIMKIISDFGFHF